MRLLRASKSSSTLRIAVLYIALALWAIAPIIIGLMNRQAEWSNVCLAAGALTLLAVGLGAWFESWIGSLFGAMLIAAAGLFVAGVVMLSEFVAAMGVLGLIVTGASLAIVWIGGDGAKPQAAQAAPQLQAIQTMLERLHANSMLSDIAKRVLFRERELGLLRQAIEEDIAHGDYNAGLTLCDDMANLFGQREEAEALRNRILQAGHAMIESRVQQALGHLEHALEQRDWAAAHREAASMKRLFPNHHAVQELDQRILAARDQYKNELEAQFLQAAQGNDVALAMSLLKQLDRYLTREEALRLAESAQRVVVTHRDNLSAQFKQAVSDRRWAQAAQIGDMIIDEYPNTKMADEVRAMIETLRSRAQQSAVAAEG